MNKDRIELALQSTGWMRLLKGFGGLWAAAMVILGFVLMVTGEASSYEIVAVFITGLLPPVGLYVFGRLTAWVIRGFLS